ncbi:hypothetical protein NA56DRAFT_317970 [Hyaloscypha hepaticicola]|uniref:Uncharacterized protein n=1 Tax=Hyaloscypha hepaticicola TaxID=2082293 RepID=A0A2J6PQB8_9HELO|nr:hypothetical protein NA56DRAFT_317970 [Hyaloscypha hepaticicola]
MCRIRSAVCRGHSVSVGQGFTSAVTRGTRRSLRNFQMIGYESGQSAQGYPGPRRLVKNNESTRGDSILLKKP